MNGKDVRALLRWALRGSNPRPSPCKGGMKSQVRGLTDLLGVPVSTPQYLSVPLRCYAKCYASSSCKRETTGASPIMVQNPDRLGRRTGAVTGPSARSGHRVVKATAQPEKLKDSTIGATSSIEFGESTPPGTVARTVTVSPPGTSST